MMMNEMIMRKLIGVTTSFGRRELMSRELVDDGDHEKRRIAEKADVSLDPEGVDGKKDR